VRSRVIDGVLVVAAVVGAGWLGNLVYHNHFGGHVERPDTSWQGSISSAGNVTTIVNEAGSVWGGTASIVEEASIGVDTGADEYMLGNIVGIAASDDRIYLIDRSVPIVRVYDHDGRYMMNIGGRGQGPGEFNSPRSLAVAPDGTLYVYGDRRINVYAPDGEPLETWPHVTGFDSGTPPVLSDDGTLYLHDLVGETNDAADWQHGMIAAGSDGPHGEHIAVPEFDYERYVLIDRFPGGGSSSSTIPFGPRLIWVMAPSKAIIAGVPSEYRFEVHAANGTVTAVERFWEPVPVSPEEREWNRRWITAARQTDNPDWEWNGPPIPDHKPAYSRLYAGTGGRIWISRVVATESVEDCDPDPAEPVGRSARTCWRQLYGYDVFGPQGKFLGSVALPDNVSLRRPVMLGDNLIGYVEDEDGVGRVKRYRLLSPGSQSP